MRQLHICQNVKSGHFCPPCRHYSTGNNFLLFRYTTLFRCVMCNRPRPVRCSRRISPASLTKILTVVVAVGLIIADEVIDLDRRMLLQGNGSAQQPLKRM